MSEGHSKGSHTIYDVQYLFVWVTKYRYHILKGGIALRAGELIRQTCEARNIIILIGYVRKDHIDIHVFRPPELSLNKTVQYIIGMSTLRSMN